MDPEERLALLLEARENFSSTFDDLGAALKKFEGLMQRVGKRTEDTGKRVDDATGKLDKLGDTFQTVAVVGGSFGAFLGRLSPRLAGVGAQITSLTASLGGLGGKLGGVAGGAGVAAGGGAAAGGGILGRLLGGAGGAAARGAGGLAARAGGFAGPIGAILVALPTIIKGPLEIFKKLISMTFPVIGWLTARLIGLGQAAVKAGQMITRGLVYVLTRIPDLFRAAGRGALWFARGARRLWDRLAGLRHVVVGLSAAVGVALATAFVGATAAGAEFESAMLRVGGVVGKMREDMPHLERAIRETAKASTFRPGEIAGAAFGMVSLGFTEAQAAGMTRGVTMLAEAMGADLAQAGETTAIMLRMWGLRAQEAVRVANLLAAANSKSAATFPRLEAAMTKAGMAANMVGMSMERTVAVLGLFFNAGLEGEQAGAALSMMMRNLLRPTKFAEEAFRQYGLTARDVNPAIHDFGTILRRLTPLLNDATAASKVFSRTGLLGALALGRAGPAALAKLEKAITGTNQAMIQQAIMTSGVAGQWKFLLSSAEELGITVTKGLMKPLADLLRVVSQFVNALAAAEGAKRFGAVLATLAERARDFLANLLGAVDIEALWDRIIEATIGAVSRIWRAFVILQSLLKSVFAGVSVDVLGLWERMWTVVLDVVEWAGERISGVVQVIRDLTVRQLGQAGAEAGRLFAAGLVGALGRAAAKVADFFESIGAGKLAHRLRGGAAELQSWALHTRRMAHHVEDLGDQVALSWNRGRATFRMYYQEGMAGLGKLKARIATAMREAMQKGQSAAKALEEALKGVKAGFFAEPDEAVGKMKRALAAMQKRLALKYADPMYWLGEQIRTTGASIERLREESRLLKDTFDKQLDAFKKAQAARVAGMDIFGPEMREMAVRMKARELTEALGERRARQVTGPGAMTWQQFQRTGELDKKQLRRAERWYQLAPMDERREMALRGFAEGLEGNIAFLEGLRDMGLQSIQTEIDELKLTEDMAKAKKDEMAATRAVTEALWALRGAALPPHLAAQVQAQTRSENYRDAATGGIAGFGHGVAGR